MPSHREENIDALRHGRCHFVIDIEGAAAAGARHPRAQAVRRHARHAGAAEASFGQAQAEGRAVRRRGPYRGELAAGASSSSTARLAPSKLACNVSSRVSSVLVGLLLALNSDALLTLPASLALDPGDSNSGSSASHQPFAPIAFPLRLMWHSSYDRDECHEWVRGEFANLAREMESARMRANRESPASVASAVARRRSSLSAPALCRRSLRAREQAHDHHRRRRADAIARRGEGRAQHPVGQPRADRPGQHRLRARLWRGRHARHAVSGGVAVEIRGGGRRHAPGRSEEARARRGRQRQAHLVESPDQRLRQGPPRHLARACSA